MFFSNFINHFFWRGTYRNAIKHIMQKGEIISDPFWQYGWPKKWHFASLIQGVSVCEGSFAWEAVLKKLLLGGPPSAIYVAVPPLSLMIFFDRYLLWCILRVFLSYLIFVIFFTRAKFLENKIYTEKHHFSRKICRKCQFFALNL